MKVSILAVVAALSVVSIGKAVDSVNDESTAEEGAGYAPSSTRAYKTTPQGDLNLHFFNPPGHQSEELKPAVVLFFGGGFRGGSPAQFYPHAAHLAARGIVAITPEYRIKNKHDTTPAESLEDARSAIRWVRSHAKELGIDPTRIGAGGGSAGGYLALATAALDDPENRSETVSSRPDALIIFNAVFATKYGNQADAKTNEEDPSAIIPKIRKPFPPTVFFLGSEDKLIPVADGEKAKAAAKVADARFDLHVYEGQGHGFFNKKRGGGKYYEITLKETDRFLVSIGWLNVETKTND